MSMSLSVALSLTSNIASKSFEKPRPYVFPIQVRSLTGKETLLQVHHKMIVSEVKSMIEKIDQTPFDQQRIIYNGKQLEDDRALDYYNIQKDSVLHIILRIRGGMFHETSARKDYEVVQCTKSNVCTNLALTIQELEETLRNLKINQ